MPPLAPSSAIPADSIDGLLQQQHIAVKRQSEQSRECNGWVRNLNFSQRHQQLLKVCLDKPKNTIIYAHFSHPHGKFYFSFPNNPVAEAGS